jgi:hypothetical protein
VFDNSLDGQRNGRIRHEILVKVKDLKAGKRKFGKFRVYWRSLAKESKLNFETYRH